jgi:hypothetical protein
MQFPGCLGAFRHAGPVPEFLEQIPLERQILDQGRSMFEGVDGLAITTVLQVLLSTAKCKLGSVSLPAAMSDGATNREKNDGQQPE